MNEHPHEGPHCVEDTLRFLNLDEHPHEGPQCVRRYIGRYIEIPSSIASW